MLVDSSGTPLLGCGDEETDLLAQPADLDPEQETDPDGDDFLAEGERGDVGRGASLSALSWTQAEMRILPKYTQTQTGYMQGAAGMGSFFLHLARVEEDSVKIPLLATPFK